jgi:hypothetical protein
MIVKETMMIVDEIIIFLIKLNNYYSILFQQLQISKLTE